MTTKTTEAIPITADTAKQIAEAFVADHLGDQIGVGEPSRVVSALQAAWVVPLVLSAPGYGIVGTVGMVIVDNELGYPSAWTPLAEIAANVERLTRLHQAELEAAFELHSSTYCRSKPYGSDMPLSLKVSTQTP